MVLLSRNLSGFRMFFRILPDFSNLQITEVSIWWYNFSSFWNIFPGFFRSLSNLWIKSLLCSRSMTFNDLSFKSCYARTLHSYFNVISYFEFWSHCTLALTAHISENEQKVDQKVGEAGKVLQLQWSQLKIVDLVIVDSNVVNKSPMHSGRRRGGGQYLSKNTLRLIQFGTFWLLLDVK